MTVEEFTIKLEDEFEDVPKGTLTPTTNYRQLEFWTSMHALIVIAFVDAEFDLLLKGDDLKNTQTISDLYNLVMSKK